MPQEKNRSDAPENAPENTEKETSKKKRASRRRIALVIAFLILAVTVPTALFSLASGDRMEGFPRPEITPEDWERQSRLTMAAMQRVLDQNNTEEFARVTLSPADVNTLLRFAINRDHFSAMFGRREYFGETVPCTGRYENGQFHLGYILRGPGAISFTLRGSVSGRYGNNRFELEPENCRIGLLPVPAWAIRPFLPHIFEHLNRDRHVQFFHMAVETIEQDKDHNIIVTYRPAQARALPRKGF